MAAGLADPVALLALRTNVAALILFALWTFIAGFLTSVLPIRICPLVLSTSAALILARRSCDSRRPLIPRGAPSPHAALTFYISTFIEFSKRWPMPESQDEQIARYADMLAALGAEPRLKIVRLLLAAHPEGLVVGEIGSELGIPPSTLSHHLDKLKNEGLVSVRRESTFLRCTANTQALQEVVGFLFAECCTRNQAIRPEAITCACP
jgi:DNA-binding transcriptional ArsR family regulator